MDAKFAKLMDIKSTGAKGVRLSKREVVKESSVLPGREVPLMIEPAVDDVDLAGWAESHREEVEHKLFKHGAILFRGFRVRSVPEFEAIAQAICPSLKGDYGDLPKEDGSRMIYHSTPYPNDKMILFHNESSHLDCWPMKQFFCCFKPSEEGGETPIVDCREVFELLKPETREKFREKRLMYVRNFTNGLDVSWRDFFHTDDRQVVERLCRRSSMEFRWKEDDGLETRTTCPAVAVHPRTGEDVFFNQIQLHHVSFLDEADRKALLSLFTEDSYPRHVFYGDGSPIEEETIEEIREVYRQATITFPWQQGDLLAVDNMLTAHARNPFEGTRKIVVAMGEMISDRELKAA